jgi:DNA-binding MarR family transcriptional regulator
MGGHAAFRHSTIGFSGSIAAVMRRLVPLDHRPTTKYSYYMTKSPSVSVAGTVPQKQRVLAHLARRLYQATSARMVTLYMPHGLTPPQFSLLAQIQDMPGTDASTLARICGLDPSSTGQALRALEAQGRILREPSPTDGRAWSFTATPEAERLMRDLRRTASEVNREMLAVLPEAEREPFLRTLTRLVEHHEADARPGAGRRPPKRRSSGPSPIGDPA